MSTASATQLHRLSLNCSFLVSMPFCLVRQDVRLCLLQPCCEKCAPGLCASVRLFGRHQACSGMLPSVVLIANTIHTSFSQPSLYSWDMSQVRHNRNSLHAQTDSHYKDF